MSIGFPKSPISSKVVRRLKRTKLKAEEDKNKAKVRRRDKFCRFPKCGCRKFDIQAECAHLEHKGMGGNPEGDRNAVENMIYLCRTRHRENRIAMHRGTLRVQPLDEQKGTNGPVLWWVDISILEGFAALKPMDSHYLWFLVASETAPGVLGELSPLQRRVLTILAEMTS